jgi:hypothetical protein
MTAELRRAEQACWQAWIYRFGWPALFGIVWYGSVFTMLWRDIADLVGGRCRSAFAQLTMADRGAADGVGTLGLDAIRIKECCDPTQCSARLREGFLSTARIILLGLAMDSTCNALGNIYPARFHACYWRLFSSPESLFARLRARWARGRAIHS